MLIKIKNGQTSKKSFVLQKKSFFCVRFLNILWSEGLILGYKELNSKILKIFLKYKKNNKPAINNIIFITKPSKRIYLSIKQLWELNVFNSILIVSTSRGLLTSNECKKYNLGGEAFLLLN
jgi:small subunit ribosomal protein S8